MTVPRLTTALAGPLPDLERRLLASQPEIERWLRGQWQEHAAPFYCSVDLRNSGFKLAPVDTNLFPGGFNNLNPDFHPLCVQAAMTAIEKICPDARGDGADPGEPHAQPVLPAERRGAADDPAAGRHRRAHRQPAARDHRPDRDRARRTARSSRSSRSSAAATAWRWTASTRAWCCSTTTSPPASPRSCMNLEQAVLPPLHAGWTVRRKSNHFAAYREVAEEFAQLHRHRPLVHQSLLREVRQDQLPGDARARNASRATSPRSSTTSAPSTGSTASSRSRSSSSRPTPAPTAWAS